MQKLRQLDLTEALLARVERIVPDEGEAAAEGLVEMTDPEVDIAAERYLADR